MAASSEEPPRKIPSQEQTATQIPIAFPGVHLPCASKDCLGLLSQGEASIVFCLAFAHCNGSGSSSHRQRTHRPFTPRTRATGAETSAFRQPCILAGCRPLGSWPARRQKLNRRERAKSDDLYPCRHRLILVQRRVCLHWRWLSKSAPGRFGSSCRLSGSWAPDTAACRPHPTNSCSSRAGRTFREK